MLPILRDYIFFFLKKVTEKKEMENRKYNEEKICELFLDTEWIEDLKAEFARCWSFPLVLQNLVIVYWLCDDVRLFLQQYLPVSLVMDRALGCQSNLAILHKRITIVCLLDCVSIDCHSERRRGLTVRDLGSESITVSYETLWNAMCGIIFLKEISWRVRKKIRHDVYDAFVGGGEYIRSV